MPGAFSTTTLASGLPYNSPVSIFIEQLPPAELAQEHPAVQQAFGELFNAVQQIIQILCNQLGIGQQIKSSWAALAGTAFTLNAGNLNRFYVIASENINAGAMINLWTPDGGVTINARNASAADNTKPCDGFCSTLGGISVGQPGEVILQTGTITAVDIVTGSRYYLATTPPGTVVTAPPVGAGTIVQRIGLGLPGGVLLVNIGSSWQQN